MAEDLIGQILNNWMFWVAVWLVIGFFVIRYLKEHQGKPEQRPFYGMEVREDMTKKQIKKRLQTFGIREKKKMKQGLHVIGNLIVWERIVRTDKKGNPEPQQDVLYLLGFVGTGLVEKLKGFLGLYKTMITKPEFLEARNTEIIIHPNAYFRMDSGVWNLTKKDTADFIEEVNTFADMQNLKGFVSDQPRRIANLDVRHSLAMDRLETEAGIEEEAKKKKLSSGKWL